MWGVFLLQMFVMHEIMFEIHLSSSLILYNFYSGSEVHGLNTRSKNQFYILTANLSVFQKGTVFAGNRLFNRLPKKG
jgi:hypothetical protein